MGIRGWAEFAPLPEITVADGNKKVSWPAHNKNKAIPVPGRGGL